MGQITQFIVNHWELWLALVIILVLILINESLAQKKRAKEISPQTAVELMNHENAAVFDLRDAETFRKGHIIDAIRINPEDFSQQRMEKYKSLPIILVCVRGIQSATVAAKLREQGYTQPLVLSGGMNAWQAADLPVVKGK